MSPRLPLLVCLALFRQAGATDPATPPTQEDRREPLALARAPGSEGFFAACANGVLVRIEERKIAYERRIATSLADLIVLADGRSLVAVVPESDEVLLLKSSDSPALDRAPVGRPTAVVQTGAAVVVASAGTRTLTQIALAPEDVARYDGPRFEDTPHRTLALPFAPREMVWQAVRERLIVADAFGGSLGLVDTSDWRLIAVRKIHAHNIRGLWVEGEDRLLIAHQIIDALARTSFDDVHWGNLVRNVVRELDLGSFSDDPGCDGLVSPLVHLGDVGNGAADPSSLFVDADGNRFVTLGGTDELLILNAERGNERRFPVGRRPVAALSLNEGTTIVVAGALDATLSFVDLETGEVESIALERGLSEGLAERGRRLFFDARLSHDDWMSCHSCHSEGHSFGGLADTLGDGSFGTPKRVLSLFGVGDTAPYAWNGNQPTLEQQIEKTLRDTMHGEDLEVDTVAALAAFLRTLPAPTTRAPAHPLEAAERGQHLFGAAGCTDCHVPPLFTSPDVYAVGLTDEVGATEFNPPSLRGVGQRARLFHDGRYNDLDALLASAGHPGTDDLDAESLADLAAFLSTL